MDSKALARQLVPPLLWKAVGRFRSRIRWRGDFASWEACGRECQGYQAPAIVKKVSDAVARVLRGEGAFERDGVVFAAPEPNLALLAALSLLPRERVSVVDFGGSLGSTFLQNRAWLEAGRVQWYVVEQAGFVEEGRRLFPGGDVRFAAKVVELSTLPAPRVLVLSSVLQYLEEPEVTLRGLLDELRPSAVFLDRVPYWSGGRHRLTRQTVPPSIYEASYPCWFFAKDQLEESLRRDFAKEFEFPSLDRCTDFESTFEGAFWRRREDLKK